VAIAAAPLLLEGLGRLTPVRRALSGTPFPAAAVSCAVGVAAWIALPFEARSSLLGLFSGVPAAAGPPLLAIAPALLPLAWCGFLIFILHAESLRGRGRSLERTVHGVVWLHLALRAASGGGSAAEFAEILPLIGWLAVAATARAVAQPRRRLLPLHGARGAFASFIGILGTLWIAFEAQLLLRDGAGLAGFGLVCSGVVIVLLFGLPTGRRLGRATTSIVVWLLLLGPGLWQSAQILGHPQRTIARASDLLERQLLPTATLGGSWARALTLGNDLAWSTDDRGDRVTHLLHSPQVRRGSLEVSRPSVLRGRLHLSRLDSARGGWSAFERGREDEANAHWRDARAHYFLVLHGEPGHATAWERIAATLLADGDRENAYRCLMHALLGDPHSVEIRQRLARIYLDHECPEEARFHLLQATRAGAPREDLTILWSRLPVELRQ
jgi:hypothetical protein